jgi:hypothetical protein
MRVTAQELRQIIQEELTAVLDEKKGKKRKAAKKKKRKKKKAKKKAAKKDACYHKVRSRYDVWPSAYASGALVKCRKVGAKNWGNKTNESIHEEVTADEEVELKKIKGELDKASKMHKSQADRIKKIVKEEGHSDKLKGSMEEMHQQIADKHGVSLEKINKQIEMGTKKEAKEHGEKKAHEIAMEHVFENPEYYTKLSKAGIED